MTIKDKDMKQYKATIQLWIPKHCDMESFENRLDNHADDLAEEYGARIRIGNFFDGRNWYGEKIPS